MTTPDALIQRVRLEMSDLKRPFYEVVTSAGVSRLDLQAENLESVFLYPKDDPGNLIDPNTYSVDNAAGRIFFDTPPAHGTMLVVEGESSHLFSDEEFQVFIDSAFAKHTSGRNPAPNYSTLPTVEDHLVAILAKIEALWVLLTSAAYDINIHAPEGMFVPRAQRYQQLRELLQMTEAQYKELSNALGVGLYTVEMFNLRRVSRLTGRYVPIYLDREVDDTRPAQRVYPEIGPMGGEVTPTTVPGYTLNIFQGRPFEETFTLYEDGSDTDPLDLTNAPEFRAELFRTPHAVTSNRYIILPEFTVEVSPLAGEVTVRLTAEDTQKLESTGSYVWQLLWQIEEDDAMTLMKGSVLIESGFPYKNVNVQVR